MFAGNVCWKCLLDTLGLPYQCVDVPFGDRGELVRITHGRVQVPALVHDDQVIVESKTICRYLLGLTNNDLGL